jgi:outer membrane lipoprotein-sorting protein
MKFVKIFLLLFVISAPLLAQDQGPELVKGVYAKMKLVQKYAADVHIDADIPNLRMRSVDAKVSFAQPDKLKVDSRSLAVLPKQGFADFGKIISDTSDFTAVKTGDEVLKGVKTSIVNILPGDPTGDLILAKLWIDPVQELVMRSQLTYRSSGTVLIDYTYGSQKKYGLPDLLQFTMDIQSMKIPKAMMADLHKGKKEGAAEKDPNRPAVILVNFTNYVVN